MQAKWYLVKYMSDPFKAEPKNVGVVVRGEDASAARFAGEQDGEFDGRRAKGVVASPDVLRSWIKYLRRHLERNTFDEALSVLNSRSLDNYFVEPRGVLLNLSEEKDIPSAVDALYADLVSYYREPVEASLDAKVDDILFRRLVVPAEHAIERDVVYDVVVRGGGVRTIDFDYRYIDGETVLMDKLSLLGAEAIIEQRINDLMFRIEHAYNAYSNNFLTMVDTSQATSRKTEDRIRVVEKYSDIVDVRDSAAANLVGQKLTLPVLAA